MHPRFASSVRVTLRASTSWQAFLLCLVLPGVGGAAIFNVNNTADLVDANPGNGTCATGTGVCTLRAAIQEANALSGTDTINLGATTYTLTRTGMSEDAASTGDLDITAPVNINGAGATSTIINANQLDRVIDIVPGAGAVSISGLTVTNGFSGIDLAGGIWNTGTLTLSNVRILDSEGRLGGGGIVNDNVLNATDVTISGCSSLSKGGALYNTGTATLTRVTISGNDSGAIGGGIQNDDTLTLTNVTLSGNTAVTDGGGISNSVSMTLKNVTFASNSANRGGGIWSLGDMTITNTIVANSTSGGNCGGAGLVTSGGSNIDTGATCGFSGAGDLSNVSAGLGSLANYGGPTETHILVAGSPAIDAGRSCPPPNTDQRGVTRPKDGNGDTTAVCDIGSVEIDGTTPTSTTSTSIATSSSTSSTSSTNTSSSTSTSKTSTTSSSTSTSSTTSTLGALCGNGIVNAGETCGEPALPACGSGQLCLTCTCRQLGDCTDTGGTPNLFDILEMIDVLLERQTPTVHQETLCDVDCDTDVDLLDVIKTIDVVLQRIQPPLLCPN